MHRMAVKMILKAGYAEEYKRRHSALWPELKTLLKESGISDYAIYLDEETNILFASLKVKDPAALDRLPEQELMQRWWSQMKDLMDSYPDNSPVTFPLKEVFYMA